MFIERSKMTLLVFNYIEQFLASHVGNVDHFRDVQAEFLTPDLQHRYPLFEYLFGSAMGVREAVQTTLKDDPQIVSRIIDFKNEKSVAAEAKDKNFSALLDPDIDAYLVSNAFQIYLNIPLPTINRIVDSIEYDAVAARMISILKDKHCIDLRGACKISNAYDEELNNESNETNVLIDAVLETVEFEGAETSSNDFWIDGLWNDSLKTSGIRWLRTQSVIPNRNVSICMIQLDSESIQPNIVESLESFLTSTVADLLVVLTVGDGDSVKEKIRGGSFILRNDLVFFAAKNLKEIAVAEKPESAFRENLLAGVPLRLLSPYKFNGPVDQPVFFGRKSELRQILESTSANFAVVGSRKIGKSSLLKAVEREVNYKKSIANTIAIYLDSSTCHNLGQFSRSLIDVFEPFIPAEDYFELTRIVYGHDSSEFLSILMGVIRRCSKTFLLLVDEADALLFDKEAEKFERFARTLANENRIRFVFSGYYRLKERITDRASHLFNLLEPIYLGPLVSTEARSLAMIPMKRINVTFQNSRTADAILAAGSTIPSLLQFFCHLLILRLEKEQRRVIKEEDVDAIANSDNFISHLCQIVEDSNMPDLERIVVYRCAAIDDEKIGESRIVDEVRNDLYETKFSSLRRALNYLVDTYIFSRDESSYRFYLPQLKNAIQRRESDINWIVRELVSEFKQSNSELQ